MENGNAEETTRLAPLIRQIRHSAVVVDFFFCFLAYVVGTLHRCRKIFNSIIHDLKIYKHGLRISRLELIESQAFQSHRQLNRFGIYLENEFCVKKTHNTYLNKLKLQIHTYPQTKRNIVPSFRVRLRRFRGNWCIAIDVVTLLMLFRYSRSGFNKNSVSESLISSSRISMPVETHMHISK